MPTRHPRIGVTRDSELASALEVTRGLLDPADARSEAGQVRRLALLGARVVTEGAPAGDAARSRQNILDRPGVRPATRRLGDLPWLADATVDEEGQASHALSWVRGAR